MYTMDYRAAREYVDRINSRKGSVLGLENIKNLLKCMGNPQNDTPIVHVAGTNGKGSFTAMLSSVLSDAGYNTGIYVSPSVFDYNERIQINGNNISDDEYAYEIGQIKKCIEENFPDENEQPTAFEIETAAAFAFFVRKKCDIAIIETGMGGRDDATNVCDNPVMSVIMSISMDHMTFLGDTIEKIAACKAGIIKNERPVVVYGQSEEIVNTIMKEAALKHSKAVITKPAENVIYDCTETSFSYTDADGHQYKDMRIGLCGTYQKDNCAVVIEAVNILNSNGFNISLKHLYSGVARATWNGRFERIGKNPDFYIDGAHNPGAALRLRESIEKYFEGKKLIYIEGVLADKDYEQIEKQLAGKAEYIYTVTPDNPRALPAEKLAECISVYNSNVSAVKSIDKAVEMAIDKAKSIEKESGEEAVIISFGSLSYLADVKKAYGNKII